MLSLEWGIARITYESRQLVFMRKEFKEYIFEFAS